MAFRMNIQSRTHRDKLNALLDALQHLFRRAVHRHGDRGALGPARVHHLLNGGDVGRVIELERQPIRIAQVARPDEQRVYAGTSAISSTHSTAFLCSICTITNTSSSALALYSSVLV